MNNWSAPQRPSVYAEQSIISAILDGTFPMGSTLPGERMLAAELGITRPTLREALQRLARDGWVSVRQGKATVVNNFWQDGGLNVLSALVQYGDRLPDNFVTHLLEVRLNLAPAYTRAAVQNSPEDVNSFLASYRTLDDTAASYASFDWELHRSLTLASGNPIYALIMNGFAGFYEQLARLYFAGGTERRLSRNFYEALAKATAEQDVDLAEAISRKAMQDSIQSWRQIRSHLSQDVELG